MRNGELGMRNIKKTTVLLCSLLFALCYLILACDNILDTPDIGEPVENGYGRISVSITEEALQTERTVMPSTAFTRYVYTFTKSDGGSGTVKTPNSDGYFILDYGNYTVEVQAYIGNAEPYTLAARGTSSQFSVGPGSIAPVEVRLSYVITGTQGKFKYTITYPEGAAAEITLQKWPGLNNITLNPGNVSQGNGKTQTLDLGTGSYLLTVVVRKNGLYAGKNEAVHIYPSNVTEYTKNFNDNDLLVEIPPTVNATGTILTAGVWENGNIALSSGEQWFRFTATAATQYIHANFFDALTSLSVQLYSSNGSTVGDISNLNSGTKNISRTVTSGQVYYIRVTPSSNSDTFQIAFNTSSTPPLPSDTNNAIPLTAGVWENGNITVSGGEQWFRFTSTASTQYIHVSLGTLTSMSIQLYNNSTGGTVGSETNLPGNNNTKYISRSVTNGRVYLIKVKASGNIGTYQIAFNTSSTPPLPSDTNNAIPLTAGAWTDGSVSATGDQWFKFTATDAAQYIHVSFGTLTNMNIQVYNSSGGTVESQANLTGSSTNISRPVTSGEVYYIRVTPYSSSYSGTYRIMINTAETVPS